MLRDDENDDSVKKHARTIAIAVATAALTTAATELATWAIESLKERYGTAKKKDDG
jgi:hypothetical protein